MTLHEALQLATRQLESSAELRADAARDAAFLLRHALAISLAAQLADPDRPLTPAQQSAYEALIQRRLRNEPIQYITGEQEFYGLALGVTPAVLIPRPETEHLVESVLAEFAAHPAASAFHPTTGSCPANPDSHPTNFACHPTAKRRDPLLPSHSLRILDIGTGSGAIAIALAHHLPNTQITAVDLSPAALAVAAANAARHGLADRIRFVQSDLLAAFSTDDLPFDAIVSNPPYVPTADRATLHPQVRDHEPSSALFAGADGLDIYRRLIPQARAALVPNGLLAIEIGHEQRDPIAALLADWFQLRFVDDLQGIPRIALARKP
ncbi:MAG: peptide chain release factor N(5)-glutamine methyltransferase [Acidobacteriaceae bacterium]|nr:peptide chain release factor N(5)-glutamine methyltransferase [Acidobacteriaceae bacterium]